MTLSWTAGAQAPAVTQGQGKPRSVAGRCGSANWVCVSQCIDVSCVDQCLAEGCQAALDGLAQCAEKSGCGADDSDCVARACDKQCSRSFEPAPPSPEKESADPCESGAIPASQVPKKLVGRWSLEGASLRPGERPPVATNETQDVKPRADYERTLVVTDKGCFLLSTRLESATLGKGNAMVVRSWGAVAVDEKKDTLELRTQDGQSVGTVCGKPRVIPLAKGKFRRPTYQYEVDSETLGLTSSAKSKQSFLFRRQVDEKKAE